MHLNTFKYIQTHLNTFKYIWIHLHTFKYIFIELDTFEYYWMHTLQQSFEKKIPPKYVLILIYECSSKMGLLRD